VALTVLVFHNLTWFMMQISWFVKQYPATLLTALVNSMAVIYNL